MGNRPVGQNARLASADTLVQSPIAMYTIGVVVSTCNPGTGGKEIGGRQVASYLELMVSQSIPFSESQIPPRDPVSEAR